jgi:hypothetical protein
MISKVRPSCMVARYYAFSLQFLHHQTDITARAGGVGRIYQETVRDKQFGSWVVHHRLLTLLCLCERYQPRGETV